RAHGFVGTERHGARHTRVYAGLGDVLRAEDVRLDRLERVVLADGHVFERRGMNDHVGASDRAAQPLAVADVADEKAKALIVDLSLHLGLLELVTAEYPDRSWIPLRKGGAGEMLTERTCSSCHQDGSPLEIAHS